MLNKLKEALKNYEWQAVSAGLAFRPFDWRLEGEARKYYAVGHVGPFRAWAGLN